jgi:copper chaperone CopZ
MTKIQLPFSLSAPLDENQISRIADLYGTYGILRVQVDPDGQSLKVEFDATRFSPKDVEAALSQAGFPLAQRSV